MQAASFSCPGCSTTLQLRESALVGKWMNCPECEETFILVVDDAGTVSAKTAKEASRKVPSTTKKSQKGHTEVQQPPVSNESSEVDGAITSKRLPVWIRTLRSPVGIAWMVAGAAALVLVIAINPFGDRTAGRESNDSTENNGDRNVRKPKILGMPSETITGSRVADARLELFGKKLLGHLNEHGHFPAGTVHAEGMAANERLSWLAALAAEDVRSSPAQPLWDRPWRDPLNDRFVRRKFSDFQNPAIRTLTGGDNFPATHYVGISGVGADAAGLPTGHPRAGIFGVDRQTRLEDIRDGTANTLLMAGVQDHLGSWAAGGQASMRSLTREPYVNGPDGFGTGQRDGMHALMADGSVRFLSKNVSPIIMRRMAAMADGFPLDPTVPGEPGDAIARPGPKPAAPKDGSNPGALLPPAVAKRPEPPVAIAREPLPRVDVEGALKLSILRFDQTRPVPLKNLLLQVEEMAGVPIRVDPEQLGASAARLDQPITVSLANASVGAILSAMLKKAGLTYEIEPNGIRIVPLPADEKRLSDQ